MGFFERVPDNKASLSLETETEALKLLLDFGNCFCRMAIAAAICFMNTTVCKATCMCEKLYSSLWKISTIWYMAKSALQVGG